MNDWEQTCNAETAGATQKAITSMAETLHHLRCLKLTQPRKWCDRLSFNLCRISAINSICLISGTCQDRSFSIVFRTFGSDLPAVQAEFNAFCAPWRQFGRTLPMASKDMSAWCGCFAKFGWEAWGSFGYTFCCCATFPCALRLGNIPDIPSCAWTALLKACPPQS